MTKRVRPPSTGGPVSKASTGAVGGEVGASGLNAALNGEVQEELHPNLTGRKAIETWKLMRDDALVGAIFYAIEMLVRQVDWRVDQGEATEEDAEFLQSCMDDMSGSWGDFMSEVLSMLPFGFAPHEVVYKKRLGYQKSGSKLPTSNYDDGKVGWRKIPLRAQETLDRWQFDDNGGIIGFVQKAPPDFVDRIIPIEKLLLFRTNVYKNNPEGRSLLRSAYASWYYKKRIQQIEGTGLERDLAGFPVFWIPSEYLAADASDEQKKVVAAFSELGKNIRRDKQEHIIMPLAYDASGNKAFDFTLMNSGGSRAFDTSGIIERYNKEIAMTVLADFILLGHENVGSFALSSDKTDLFAVALGTILDIISDVMNRHAVPRLWELNAMDTKTMPKIEHGDIEKPDLDTLGAFLQSLSAVGFTLSDDEDVEAYLREVGSLPEKSEETKKKEEEAKAEEEAAAQEPAVPGAPAPAVGNAANNGAGLQASIDAARRG